MDREELGENEPTSSEETIKVKLTKAEKKAKYRTDYKEPIKSRRETLKSEFAQGAEGREERIKPLILQYISEDLESGVNVYGSVLDHFRAMPDKTKNSEFTLAACYLESFEEWLEDRDDREELSKKFLSKNIQIDALKECGTNFSKYCHTVFELNHKDLESFILTEINEKISKLEFKEAADMALGFKIKERFGLEQLIIPLVLQDRLKLAYELMKDQPNLQKQYAQWLDSFVDKLEAAVEDSLQKYKDKQIMTVSANKFYDRPLNKYMNSFYKKVVEEYEFQLDSTRDSPKYAMNAHFKALKHVVSSRYDDNSKQVIHDEQYFQHVRDTTQQCKPEVTEKFLHYLWSSNQEEKRIDAISWVRFLKLKVDSTYIPRDMNTFFSTSENRKMIEKADDLLKHRLTFEVPDENCRLHLFGENQEQGNIDIIMITTDAALDFLCTEIHHLDEDEDGGKFVGIDTEWKPPHLIKKIEMKIAIMQIYLCKKIYIIDCVKLEETSQMKNQTWQKFARRLLCSKTLRIIGFDLWNDIDALLSINHLKDYIKKGDIKNVLCLKKLTENICEIDIAILELSKKTFKLADLATKFLEITLNKTEQCSNWQSRPLRKDQILYAAMDAYVVVEIYKKIMKIAVESNPALNTETLLAESNVLAPKKESTTKKEQKKLDLMKWHEIYEILKDHRNEEKEQKRPYEIKCIVDSMLLGFGKYLRRCGVDVIIPSNVQKFHEKLKAMQRIKEMRYILTVPSKSFESLRAQYSEYTIPFVDVTSKAPIEQLISFFNEFNVEIREDDICLRCVDCNSRYLVKFPAPVVQFLHQYVVVYLQNLYRPDMSAFLLNDWYKKMEEIDPNEYGGIVVKMSRPTEDSDWIVASTDEGVLHITRNIVLHNNCADGVEVRISKVPDDAFKRPNMIFYLCSDCGKVSYDGKEPPKSTPTSASCSNESVTSPL